MESIANHFRRVIEIPPSSYEEYATLDPPIVRIFERSNFVGLDYSCIQEAKVLRTRVVKMRKNSEWNPVDMGRLVRFADGQYGMIIAYKVTQVGWDDNDSYTQYIAGGALLNTLTVRLISYEDFKKLKATELAPMISKCISHAFVGFA